MNPPPDFSHGQVVLYATDGCPYCEKTRALLAATGLPYQEFNIETSNEARNQYQRMTASDLPVLLVAGEVVRGYHQEKMAAILDAWQLEHKPAVLSQQYGLG